VEDMSDHLPSINLDLVKKLRRDRTYRQTFFLAETSALIAKQLIELRKRRGLNQTQVAEALQTQQPAISRVERADYRNWSFNTLRRIAEALDARLRIVIEPAEDVLRQYEAPKEEAKSIGPPSPMKDFHKWLRESSRRSPVGAPRKIIDDEPSAATSAAPIAQPQPQSLLNEFSEQKIDTKGIRNYDDTRSAAWS
jgi:transcriptional regulator with XRE-family HTH domain